MKKSKLLAMALLSSAIALTSCQKKEGPGNVAQPAPQVETQQQASGTQQPEEAKQEVKQEIKQEVKQESKPQEQKSEEKKEEKKQEPSDTKKESKEQSPKTDAVSKVDGEAIFKSKGCTACHQPNTESVGPALSKIASAYKGNKDGLIKFLNGEGKSIVDPAKEAIMKPNLETTKKLSAEEKNALAEFILKH